MVTGVPAVHEAADMKPVYPGKENHMGNRIVVKGGMVYQCHTFAEKDVEITDERISAVAENIAADGAEVIDAAGMHVVPGFLDIHTHGSAGVDVNAATAEDYEKICRFQASQGTAGWMASVLTDTREQTLWCIDQFLQWQQMEHHGAEVLGIHLEGPFLSAQYKGAMPEHLLQKPNLALLKEYQEAAKGNIRYITVSPEIEGMVEFIAEIRKLGIVPAIGHSGADYDTARRAIANGAAAATHTGNAMRLLHQHEPAIWGAVLEDDDVYCEMICDGRHLHPGTVRLILKTKGYDHAVAVTDSIMAAGLPDGRYKLGVNDVIVKDGDARLAVGDSRAGSTLTTGQGLKNLLAFTGRPLAQILPLMTENPAKLLGFFGDHGSITTGKYADIVLLDGANNVCKNIVHGRVC